MTAADGDRLRRRRGRTPSVIVSSVCVVLISSACASPQAGAGSPTASGAPSAVARAAPASGSASAEGAVGTIGFDHVGALTIRMTAAEVGERLDARVQTFSAGPGCSYGTYTPHDGSSGPLTGLLSTQMSSEKSSARVDVLGFGGRLGTAGAPAGLPRTEKGIGMGSTVAQVRASYPTGLTEKPSRTIDGYTELRLTGPDDTGIAFLANTKDVVEQVSVGRLELQDAC